ncbi:MAG: NgoPII family restriction endonuclease [Candidatus Woesearchaeota archaeon]
MKKTNLLQALINIDKVKNNNVKEIYTSKNRINNLGDSLEYFIKDLFCNSFEVEKTDDKEKEYKKYLSYLGNKNNPPDFIIKNGDAVEVKKISSQGSSIALNSSFPKNKLHITDSRITEECRNIDEDWTVKDMLYVIGVIKSGKLKLLWFIDGDCYAANKETYLNTYNSAKEKIQKLESEYTLTQTNEIGKIKNADPLSLTQLRIRGMWHIENPLKVYGFLDEVFYDEENDLGVYAIIKKDKYDSFNDEMKQNLQNKTSDNLKIKDIKIDDPNNSNKKLNAKLIYGIYNF